ncbi:hypothetical protein KDAU_45700 [Dictyobacter aurantiacus]|uniref:Uncharacterized protein n=1 Tax=Dictyobacter aurantiacus TaxID=1936993 RepID=A0A401ZK58_9CHLR|nr:hypothetical protein KDAU_45700 [Dictyobacter aurantiacus]
MRPCCTNTQKQCGRVADARAGAATRPQGNGSKTLSHNLDRYITIELTITY